MSDVGVADGGLHPVQSAMVELGGSQCVTISANQCTASNVCQNRFIFTIKSNGYCMSAGPCNEGGFCHKHDEKALCSTGKGLTIQRCCCKNADAGACAVAAFLQRATPAG